ncbi:MAG TPA: hypothetical protein VGQ41_27900 [Pyrinomonadaceae bacterium]|nr:hypothetical protein [Pyrinomonadaceae bacterium]
MSITLSGDDKIDETVLYPFELWSPCFGGTTGIRTRNLVIQAM